MKYLLIIIALLCAACGPKCEKAHDELKLQSSWSDATHHQESWTTITVCDQYAAQ